MNRKIWLFIAIVLLSGPSVLPISLEAFFLVELVGFLGIWSMCSSYVYAICAHPYTRRFGHVLQARSSIGLLIFQ